MEENVNRDTDFIFISFTLQDESLDDFDPEYEFDINRLQQKAPLAQEEEEEEEPHAYQPSSTLRRPLPRNRSFRPADFAQRRNSTSDAMQMMPTDLPMELDQLESLASLCFPGTVII